MSKVTRVRVAKDYYRVDVDGTPVGFVQVNRLHGGAVQSFLLVDLDDVGIRLAESHSLPGAADELVAEVSK